MKPKSAKGSGRFAVAAGLFLVVVVSALAFSGLLDKLLLAAVSLMKGSAPAPHTLNRVRLSFAFVLLCGGLPLTLGSLTPASWFASAGRILKERYVLVAAMAVLILLWLPPLLLGRSAIMAGHRYWWLDDDAMISMRYARNLAAGAGLVWNPGMRVEGYSNLLWTLFMALVHFLRVPAAMTSLVVLLANLVLAAATVPVIIRLVRLLGGGALATAASLAGYVLCQDTMYWATSGGESILLMLLFLWAACRILHESKLDRPRPATYLLIAVMSLVRADAVVLGCLLGALALVLTRNRRSVLLYFGLSLLLPALHELFRLYYYHALLPNTAYLKTEHWPGRTRAGLLYTRQFITHYPLVIALAVAGALGRSRQALRACVAVFLIYVAYITYLGGDTLYHFRFLVPVLPLVTVLAFVGIQRLRPPLRLTLVILGLVTTPLIAFNYADYLRHDKDEADYVRIGLLLKQNTQPTARVADFQAGTTIYFSERYGIDLLGKSDSHIAHMPVASNGRKPGLNKFDFDYSLGVLKPDLVVTNFKLPVTEDSMRRASVGDWAYHGQLYFNPVFREHYLPNPVAVETRRTIFAADWSPERDRINDWKDLSAEAPRRP
ncbi:MAG TPA: hypothetical protein VMH22_01100 [bacterium]|nr:hypothetical protein [bacterium]